MTMLTARFAIIGGGLSGLYAASLLEQQGIKDYVLIEARDTFGGRIVSASSSGEPISGTAVTPDEDNRFDLGATWFWPESQPELDRLIDDLHLERFEQNEMGYMMVERSPTEPPSRVRAFLSSPPSMRLVGGMSSLIDAVRGRLQPTRLINGQRVRRMCCTESHVELDAEDAHGHVTSYRVAHVLLAVPPRLAATTIEFTPALPEALAQEWRDEATWMAPHAKYIAIYDSPFWREQGLSGEARSAIGPLTEIHDASAPRGSAALFGFFGVPARIRSTLSDDVLRSQCRAQLTRLFGSQAAMPKGEVIKDWAREPTTATAADQHPIAHYGTAPAAEVRSGIWRRRIVGIASEWSPVFSGYVAGAVEAADRGVQALIQDGTV